jgi:hypothetical protein
VIKTPRRYFLAKRLWNQRYGESELAGVFRAKQEAEPGTTLPATFGLVARLSDAGYTTVEDLDGADDCELQDAGFTAREAASILEELQPLLP